jgi:pimeloyl-ACP methyl ester carboxylesterase
MNQPRQFPAQALLSKTSTRLSFVKQDVGADVTFLLLHGVTRRAHDWMPAFPELAGLGNVVACDFRGHGESDRASSYFVTDYADDVVEFLSAEIASPVVIVGHSLGAMVAAAVAARLPERVRAVVLEDPPFETMGAGIIGTAWQHQFIGMQSVVQKASGDSGLADKLADVSIPQADGTSKKLGELRSKASLEWSAQCLQTVDPEVFTPLIQGRWLHGYDRLQILATIRCPSLLLQADPGAGGALTDADASEAAAAMQRCRHVRLGGAGHQLHRDHLEAFLSCLNEFMSQSLG